MKFTLEQNHRAELDKLANTGMTPVVIAQRAKILLMKADGKSASAIAEELGVSRHTAELWIKKYRTRSEEDSVKDLLNVDKGCGRKEKITDEAKTWLISIACTQPKDYGYVAETWTIKALTQHINKTAVDAGYERLANGSRPSQNPVYIEFWTSAGSCHFVFSIIVNAKTRTSTRRWITCCWFISRSKCSSTKKGIFSHSKRARWSMLYRMMRSPEYRQLQTLQMTCRQLKTLERSSAIMNTNVSAQYHCSRG